MTDEWKVKPRPEHNKTQRHRTPPELRRKGRRTDEMTEDEVALAYYRRQEADRREEEEFAEEVYGRSPPWWRDV